MAESRGMIMKLNYKKLMKKIMEQLQQYEKEVNELATSYATEKARHEKHLEGMEGKYTPEFVEQSRRDWKPSIDYKKVIDLARESHRKIAMSYFDKIKSELDGYFQIPVDSGFANTVSAIKAVGVTLTNREFELLQGVSGGYWGLRLLNELGISRTKTEQRIELKDGQPERTEKESKIPYGSVKLPDIEIAYDSLQGVKNSITTALSGYCGMNNELADIIFPLEQPNDNFKKEYGIEPPKQTRDALTISQMAASKKCFSESYQTYTAFAGMMSSIEDTMPKPKKKTVLTESDKRLIDAMIDPRYPSLEKEKVLKIAKADERLRELLLLDERYSAEVKAALKLDEDENETEPENTKESATGKIACDLARESARRFTTSKESGRQAIERYSHGSRKA